MTVITGSVTGVAGGRDSRWWVFTSVLRQGSGEGEVITTMTERVKPSGTGVLTVDLEPGPATLAFDGYLLNLEIPETGPADLWDLIEEAVSASPGAVIPSNAIALKGAKGDDGTSAYAAAVAEGFVGTEAEWLDSLKGDQGDPGVSGDWDGLTNKPEFVVELPAGTGNATTDTATIQNAINALPEGGTIRLARGSEYLVNSVTWSDKSVTIDGNNATVIGNANSPAITATGGWEWIRDVSAIAESTLNSVATTRLTLADVSDLEPGDVLRLVADDIIPGSKPGSGGNARRIGEFVVVASVDAVNDYVYLSGPVNEDYVTNSRLAKLRRRQVIIKDLKLSVSDAAFDADYDPAVLEIRALWAPILDNVQVLRSCGAGIVPRGCYAYRVANSSVDKLPNDPTLFRFGYGVADTSSEYGVVTGLTAGTCRHAYTTVGDAIPADSDPMMYGRTAHARVIASTALGASHVGFDTHDEAFDIQFVNCVTYAPYKEGTSIAAGYTARGRRISYDGCKVFNARYGFQAFEQFDGSTDGVTYNNCEAIGSTEYGLHSVISSSDGGTRVRNVRVNGGRFEGRVAGAHLENADVELVGRPVFKVIPSPSAPSSAHGIRLTSSTALRGESLSIDLSDSNATTNNAVRVESGASAMGLDRGEVLSGSKTISQVFSGASAPGAVDARNWALDEAPASAHTGFSSIKLEWKVRDNLAVGSGLVDPKISQIIDANGNVILDLSPTASAVNRFQVGNAATNGEVVLRGVGSDAAVNVAVRPQGTNGKFHIRDGNNVLISRFISVGSAANRVEFTASATGDPVTISTAGSDPDVDLNLVTQGDGQVLVNGDPIGPVSPETAGAFWYPSPDYASGNYYYCNSAQASSTSALLNNGAVRLTPWVVVAPVTITALFAEFSVAGDAASVFRIGIWEDDGFKPGALILDAGSISTGTGNAGTVATGGTPGKYELSASQTLQPGIYWVGGAVQGVTGTQPTMRTVNASSLDFPVHLIPLGTSLGSVAAAPFAYSGGTQTGAFTNVTSPAVSGVLPVRIGFKVA